MAKGGGNNPHRGNNGGKGGGGKGGGGKGGKKGKNKGPFAGLDLPKYMKQAIKAGGRLAFGDELSQINKDIKGAKNHKQVVNDAFDAYATELDAIKAANVQNQQNVQSQLSTTAQQLGVMGDQASAQDAHAAAQRAALLGQGTGVADTFTGVGQAAGTSRAQSALAGITGQANIGLANSSNLDRVGAIGERDRIRAQEDRRKHVQELRAEKRKTKGDKGAYMAEKIYEMIQQGKENQIAMMGLQLDKKNAKFDRKMEKAEHALDVYDTHADNRRADREDRHQRNEDRRDRERGGNGGGNNNPTGGLSPSERQAFRDAKQGVSAAQKRIQQIMSSQGVDITEARRRAQTQGGFEEWEVRLASQLVKNGKLTAAGKKIWKSHIPGGGVPKGW